MVFTRRFVMLRLLLLLLLLLLLQMLLMLQILQVRMMLPRMIGGIEEILMRCGRGSGGRTRGGRRIASGRSGCVVTSRHAAPSTTATPGETGGRRQVLSDEIGRRGGGGIARSRVTAVDPHQIGNRNGKRFFGSGAVAGKPALRRRWRLFEG